MNGLITNIQRFSTHDGPGIRTTVFLKGCNMRCFWCHNPENLSSNLELQVFSNRCIGCMNCSKVCTKSVHYFDKDKRTIERESCIACGECVRACPAKALQLSGEKITQEELIKRIDRDSPFYSSSGGGVTFSGGEPLLQKDYLGQVLLSCRKRAYHTAVESALNVPWEIVESISSMVDLFIIDIKTTDSSVHKSVTGADNKLILENIKELDSRGNEIWIRIPVIPDVNDRANDIISIREFIEKLKNVTKVELIPFHKLGTNKYISLGLEYKALNLEVPSEGLMQYLNSILKGRGEFKSE